MAKYIIEIPDEVPVSDELVPFDMCRPPWYWEAYKKGKAEAEDEVWDFVRIITDMTECDRKECFGGSTCDLDEYMTYQEARAQYEAWEQKKEEVHVGDEVTSKFGDGVVIDIVADESVHVLGEDGHWNEYADGEYRKTGRHFDEVEKLLERMKAE